LSGEYPAPGLANGAVTSANILDGTIQQLDVDPSFRTPNADSADYVRNLPSSIDSARIAGTVPANSIDAAKLAPDAVTTEKISDGTIRRFDVDANFKAPDADSADYVRNLPSAVDSARIAGTVPANSIDAAKLAPDAVTSAKIGDGSIQRIDVDPNFKAPNADSADYVRNLPSFIDSARIAGTVPVNSIDGEKLAANSVTSAKISDGSIQSVDVDPNFKAPMADSADYVKNPPPVVDSARIAGTVPDNSIANANIQDSTITPVKLAFVPGTVDGTGSPGQVAFWSGRTIISGNNNLFWDDVNLRLGVVKPNPAFTVDAKGSSAADSLHGDLYQDKGTSAPLRVKSNGNVMLVADNNNDDPSASFTFFNNGEGAANIVMTLAESGNLGIGVPTPNSRLHVAGPISTAVKTIGADIVLDDSHSMVLCDGPAGTTLNIGLPSAAGIAGRQYTLKNIAGNSAVNIKPFSTETIDGVNGYLMDVQYKYVTLLSDGANWFIIGNN
jgi:hypothetical protein